MSENLPQVMEQATLLPSTFAEAQKYAEMMAKSDLVPMQFKGKAGNCLIALQLSRRLGVDPLMMMQGMYVVHGNPGLYGKFVIALANAKGPFAGPIEFDHSGTGKTRQCRAYATVKATGKVVESIITMDMAEKEQWTKNTKWLSMPDQMLAYRAAAFLARLYCPEVLMGMQTVEELRDVKIVAGVEVADDEEPVQLPSSFATAAPRSAEASTAPIARSQESGPPAKEGQTGSIESSQDKKGGISPEGMVGWMKNIEDAELRGGDALVALWKENSANLKRLATPEQMDTITGWKDAAKARLMGGAA